MATGKKVAAKAAPAPAPVAAPEPQDEGVTLEVGTKVKFLGYAPDTAEDEQVLTEGEVYEVAGFTEADDSGASNPILAFANPEFNAKKKEHPETNPRMLEVEVFAEELEIAEEAEEEAEAAPAPVAAKKAAPAKAAVAAPAKGKAAAAAPAGKGKKAPAAAKPPKAPKPVAEPVDPDAVPTLETEDAEVIALVEGSPDLIVTAQELEASMAASEFQLGGVLYHIKKNKAHHALLDDAGKPLLDYQSPGGFEKFLQEFFTIEYRKAMYLIDIYVNFNMAGIENAAARVAQIGWTKASKIARHMNTVGNKAEDLLTLAEENTVADLSKAIMETVHVGGTKGEPVKRLTLKFRYLENDAATVNSILETAKAQFGVKDVGDALLQIVTEWAQEHGGGTVAAKAAPAQRAAAPAAKKVAAKRATA